MSLPGLKFNLPLLPHITDAPVNLIEPGQVSFTKTTKARPPGDCLELSGMPNGTYALFLSISPSLSLSPSLPSPPPSLCLLFPSRKKRTLTT